MSGVSVALRRLVETARKGEAGADASRARTAAAYRFVAATGGDLPGFEEAARALFAADRPRLETLLAWPADLRDETLVILDRASAGRGPWRGPPQLFAMRFILLSATSAAGRGEAAHGCVMGLLGQVSVQTTVDSPLIR